MPPLSPQAEAAELGRLLKEAAQIAVDERKRMKREIKPDGSIVTNADKAVERFLRQELPRLVEGANVWGEEEGFEEPGRNGLWLVDPVDGTTNFAYHSPLWGISVAIARNGVIDLGGIILPDLDETYLAVKGQGATLNGAELPKLEEGPIKPYEVVSYCEGVPRCYPGKKLPGKMRCAGAFVIDGTFVASGRYRGLIGFRERLYDVAASVLIGRELGADVRYVDGSPFDETDLMTPDTIGKCWVIFPPKSGFVLSQS